MNTVTAKALASVAICAAGAASMYFTKDTAETGIGWAVLGLLIIWG